MQYLKILWAHMKKRKIKMMKAVHVMSLWMRRFQILQRILN